MSDEYYADDEVQEITFGEFWGRENYSTNEHTYRSLSYHPASPGHTPYRAPSDSDSLYHHLEVVHQQEQEERLGESILEDYFDAVEQANAELGTAAQELLNRTLTELTEVFHDAEDLPPSPTSTHVPDLPLPIGSSNSTSIDSSPYLYFPHRTHTTFQIYEDANIPVVHLFRNVTLITYRPPTTYEKEHSLHSFDNFDAYRRAVTTTLERVHSYVVQTIQVEIEIISDFYTIEQNHLERTEGTKVLDRFLTLIRTLSPANFIFTWNDPEIFDELIRGVYEVNPRNLRLYNEGITDREEQARFIEESLGLQNQF